MSERPMSSMERARLFAQGLKHGVTRSTPPESFAGVSDTTITGELVHLKEYLDEFDVRLREPRVGQIMDASNATSGRLYDVRRDLASKHYM